MKRIVYTRPDGGLSVVTPYLGSRLMLPQRDGQPAPEPEEIWLARVHKQSVPDGSENVHIVDVTDIPADRAFRDAWSLEGKRVAIDMPRARDIHRDRIRNARKPLLLALDVEYLRAIEDGDVTKQNDVKMRKQALRDAPADPAIAAATSAEALAAVWPLPGKSK